MTIITCVGFLLVIVFFAVALYARHRMLSENPRPGYIFDQEDTHDGHA